MMLTVLANTACLLYICVIFMAMTWPGRIFKPDINLSCADPYMGSKLCHQCLCRGPSTSFKRAKEILIICRALHILTLYHNRQSSVYISGVSKQTITATITLLADNTRCFGSVGSPHYTLASEAFQCALHMAPLWFVCITLASKIFWISQRTRIQFLKFQTVYNNSKKWI